MKRTVAMATNYGPNTKAPSKFKGFRKVRVMTEDGYTAWRKNGKVQKQTDSN